MRSLPQLRRFAVNEFGTKLYRDGRCLVMQREDPSADAFPSLQHDELDTGSLQKTRGFQAGDASAENCHLYSCRLHDVRGVWRRCEGRKYGLKNAPLIMAKRIAAVTPLRQ